MALELYRPQLLPSEYFNTLRLLRNCRYLSAHRRSKAETVMKFTSTYKEQGKVAREFERLVSDQLFKLSFPELALEPTMHLPTEYEATGHLPYTWEAFHFNAPGSEEFVHRIGLPNDSIDVHGHPEKLTLPVYPVLAQKGVACDFSFGTAVAPRDVAERAQRYLEQTIARAPDPLTNSYDAPWVCEARGGKKDSQTQDGLGEPPRTEYSRPLQVKHSWELLSKVTAPGTFYHALCGLKPVLWREVVQLMSISTKECFQGLPADTDFLYMNISGYGVKTGFHAVYPGPVYDYAELNYQKPQYITVDGDGTVPLVSALADGFPDEYLYGRCLIDKVDHMSLVQNHQTVEFLLPFLKKANSVPPPAHTGPSPTAPVKTGRRRICSPSDDLLQRDSRGDAQRSQGAQLGREGSLRLHTFLNLPDIYRDMLQMQASRFGVFEEQGEPADPAASTDTGERAKRAGGGYLQAIDWEDVRRRVGL